MIRSGAGNDSLDGGEPGRTRDPDRLDGGAGRDRVGWTGTRLAVRASLSRGRMAGQGDRGVSIEGLTGGRRDDRLVGDERANVWAGGDGNDVLIGRGGADLISPGRRELDVDDARCGTGRDRVDVPQYTTYVRSDCELIVDQALDDAFAVAPRIRLLDGRRMSVTVPCSEDEDSDLACGEEVELLSAPYGLPGVPRGQKSLRLAPLRREDLDGGAMNRVVFRLSVRGRRIVGTGGVIVCVNVFESGYCARVPRLSG